MLAACVVVAVGTEPATTWLRSSGLPLEDGVVCEPTCHVVGVTDVVAAGDVAQWPNLRFDASPRRIEHWLNAVEMGRAAAESLLAGRAAAKPFTPMPRFWTEHYGVRIQAAGVPKLGTDTVMLGTSDGGTGTVIGYVRENRLVGVVGLDCPSSVLAWTQRVSEQNPVSPPQGQPVRTGQQPAVSVPSARESRTGRYSLPAKPKPARLQDRPNHTNGRLRPVESSGRITPVEINDWSLAFDSNGRLRSLDTNGRMSPADMDSTGRIPVVDTNGRMRPTY
jgi:hypothetical protein